MSIRSVLSNQTLLIQEILEQCCKTPEERLAVFNNIDKILASQNINGGSTMSKLRSYSKQSYTDEDSLSSMSESCGHVQQKSTKKLYDSRGKLNLNVATFEDMMRKFGNIPYIGPAKCKGIIQFRDEICRGQIRTPEEFARITSSNCGVGIKTYDKIKDLVCF